MQDTKSIHGPSRSHHFIVNVNLCVSADLRQIELDKRRVFEIHTETDFCIDLTISYLKFFYLITSVLPRESVTS